MSAYSKMSFVRFHRGVTLKILLTPIFLFITLSAVACSVGAEAPPPSPTPVSSPDRSGNEVDAELKTFLAAIDNEVASIRGVEVPPQVPFRFLNDQEMKEYVGSQIEEPEFRESLETSEALLSMLGLISPGTDLTAVYEDLLGTELLGAYDFEIQEFVIRDPDGTFDASEELTYAHEYVHRLQDAKFGIKRLIESTAANDDAALALTALIEGDATRTQVIYGRKNFVYGELLIQGATSDSVDETSLEVPYVLQQSLVFPYVAGVKFAVRLADEGGNGIINTAFRNPPISTEQIIHPDKYLEGELPIEVTLDTDLFGEGWNVVAQDTLGEFTLQVWLEAHGWESQGRLPGSVGWGGDTYIQFENPERGENGVAMLIAWDDPASDSKEFVLELADLLGESEQFTRLQHENNWMAVFDGPDGVFIVGRAEHPTLGFVAAVVVAPTQQLADDVFDRVVS